MLRPQFASMQTSHRGKFEIIYLGMMLVLLDPMSCGDASDDGGSRRWCMYQADRVAGPCWPAFCQTNSLSGPFTSETGGDVK